MTYDHKPNPAHDTIVALAELFRACFSVFQGRRKPLKIGIRDDVMAALNGAISEKEAGFALKIYTSNSAYLRACKQGAPRIGLNGGVCGHVTAEEADNARQRLAAQRDHRYGWGYRQNPPIGG
jgi:ProP effector